MTDRQTEIPFEAKLKREFWQEHQCKKKTLVWMKPCLDDEWFEGICGGCGLKIFTNRKGKK